MKTPLRPVRLTFVLGKGLVKRRRESENPTQFVAENLAAAVADDNWPEFKTDLEERLRSDVRVELAHLAGQFRYHIIGLGANKQRPGGTLTTASKGSGQPRRSLAQAFGQDWIPRDATYLRRKQEEVGHRRWFEYGGFLDSQFRGESLGGASEGSGFSNIGAGAGGSFGYGGGIFEDLFGPVRVTVKRNDSGTGTRLSPKAGGFTNQPLKRGHVQLRYARVEVRALGALTDSMLEITGSRNNSLINLIHREEPELAYRLGGRGPYRPTLEPFLKFFLREALPFAVQQRLKTGQLSKSILRSGRR